MKKENQQKRGLQWFMNAVLLIIAFCIESYSQQPILYAPWEGIATITQGNYGSYSHDDCHHRKYQPENCNWENMYAVDVGLKTGTPVLAPADGIVTWVKDDVSRYGRGLAIGVFGPLGNKFEVVFLHLSKICVKSKQKVSRGQIIALSGASGKGSENGFDPHLHFHIWAGWGDRASHTQPIERLVLRKVGTDKNFVFYSSPRNRGHPEVYTLHDKNVRGKLFESSNTRTRDLCSLAIGAPVASLTATILVMDVSGSMGRAWRGGVKIESAKKAALQFIEQVTNEPRPVGSSHMIGVVTFSSGSTLACSLTDNYAQAKHTVIQLGTLTSTNLGAGLVTALQELERLPATARKFIILLSDGKTNTGMSRSQILNGPVSQARIKEICIHTVGFGDPGDIDEEFLKKIAAGSGCGSYNYAATGFALFGTYVKVRHRMLGSNRIVEFTSETGKGSRVWVIPGQSIALGAFQLTAPARELHFTLAWAEVGRMVAKLIDPTGRQVTASYPGAQVYSGQGFSHITVFSPRKGIWRAAAQVLSAFPSGVQYYGVVSARTGGFVIPYEAPKICVFDDFCIPIPDIPTWLLVGISLVALAVVVYQQIVGGR